MTWRGILNDLIVTVGRMTIDTIDLAYKHGYRDAMRDIQSYARKKEMK